MLCTLLYHTFKVCNADILRLFPTKHPSNYWWCTHPMKKYTRGGVGDNKFEFGKVEGKFYLD